MQLQSKAEANNSTRMTHLSNGLVITPKLPVLASVGSLTPFNREQEEEAQYLYDLAGKKKSLYCYLCLHFYDMLKWDLRKSQNSPCHSTGKK